MDQTVDEWAPGDKGLTFCDLHFKNQSEFNMPAKKASDRDKVKTRQKMQQF
jgi:hypothetical protein